MVKNNNDMTVRTEYSIARWDNDENIRRKRTFSEHASGYGYEDRIDGGGDRSQTIMTESQINPNFSL